MPEHEIRSGVLTASKISGRDEFDEARTDVDAASDLERVENDVERGEPPLSSIQRARRYRDAASWLRDQAAILDTAATHIHETLNNVTSDALKDDYARRPDRDDPTESATDAQG